MYSAYYNSPIGVIQIKGSDKGIEELNFLNENDKVHETDKLDDNMLLCIKELNEYFTNRRKNFTVKLNIKGTEFQKKVWNELLKIPYGECTSYKDIATKVGNSKAARAVGLANNKNKIAIIIPCHRVIGASGKLTGYAGGTYKKQYLINLEKLT